MQSKAMQSKILLKMQSEAKQSIAQQSNAKQFKAMQSTAQAQHKQSKSKAKAMFRELQRASESFRELQRASESSNRRHTKATAKQKQSKSTAHIPFILKHHQFSKMSRLKADSMNSTLCRHVFCFLSKLKGQNHVGMLTGFAFAFALLLLHLLLPT